MRWPLLWDIAGVGLGSDIPPPPPSLYEAVGSKNLGARRCRVCYLNSPMELKYFLFSTNMSVGVTLYAFGVPLGTPTEKFGTLMDIFRPNASKALLEWRPHSEDLKKADERCIQGGYKKGEPKSSSKRREAP